LDCTGSWRGKRELTTTGRAILSSEDLRVARSFLVCNGLLGAFGTVKPTEEKDSTLLIAVTASIKTRTHGQILNIIVGGARNKEERELKKEESPKKDEF